MEKNKKKGTALPLEQTLFPIPTAEAKTVAHWGFQFTKIPLNA